MIKSLRNMFKRIKIILSLPSVWLAFLILVLAVVSICISKAQYLDGKVFESSIFSNIFAGLSTGFIIIFLSGTKSLYISYLLSRLLWLQKTHELILVYMDRRHELLKSNDMTTSVFYDKVYDAAACASNVNMHILQSTFDRAKWFDPRKYFLRHYSYDSIEKATYFNDLHDFLCNYGEDDGHHEEVIKRISETTQIMHSLNSSINNDISFLKIKISTAQKSII